MTRAQLKPSKGSDTSLVWNDSHLPRIPEKSAFPLLSSLCTRGLDSTHPMTIATPPRTSVCASALIIIGLDRPFVILAKSSDKFLAAMCTPPESRSSTTMIELCNSTWAWGLLENTTRSASAIEDEAVWDRTNCCKGILRDCTNIA